jgi:hypothetical protein
MFIYVDLVCLRGAQVLLYYRSALIEIGRIDRVYSSAHFNESRTDGLETNQVLAQCYIVNCFLRACLIYGKIRLSVPS